MNKKVLLGLFVVLILSSCADTSDKTISFYHWKSEAKFNEAYQEALDIAHTEKIYLHYFDIDNVTEPNWNNDGIFPIYTLNNVSDEYQKFEIVPVIYIVNGVFETPDLDITDLSERIKKLVNQISEAQFNKEIKRIQIDCDWTKSTRSAYFELLNQLKNDFEIDVTIRLHQIKYQEETGVPPVEKGTLMLYNVGDLRDKQQNSILEVSIVEQYVNDKTSYPLSLNVGLPLFSQTIITNNDGKIKLIKNTERAILENDNHFKQMDDMNFTVVKDTLYKGFFLVEGYNLKLEELNVDEIIASYKLIKESDLNINEIIFYHLDEQLLSNINLKKIIKKL